MKENPVFDYLDYRQYLAHRFPAKGEGRGGRSVLARHLNCELSFISLVFNRHAHFSAEHAYGTAEFLKLTDAETEFFMLLFARNRAGTTKLEGYYQRKIDRMLKRRNEVRERVQPSQKLTLEQQVEYYSHWAYTAIHMALLNPQLNTAEKISRALGLPLAQTRRIVEFFLQHGLAIQDSRGLRSGPTSIHVPNDSPLVVRHHANWRLKTMETFSSPVPEDLHYSAVMSISRADAKKIRSILLDAIEKVDPTAKDSKDETVHALNLDLFEVSTRNS